jgi:hypothetical protein
MGTFCFSEIGSKRSRDVLYKNLDRSFQGTLWLRDIVIRRDIVIKGHNVQNCKHPGTFQTRDIMYKGRSDQIKDLRRGVVIKGRFKQPGP